MMSDLRALYQELILDHSKSPRNFGVLDPADRESVGYNPLCGDKLKLFLKLEDDKIQEIKFAGTGCAISQASASMMSEFVKGHTLTELPDLFASFHDLATGETKAKQPVSLGKLEVFAGLRDYPTRVKCATLAWHTLKAACEQKTQPVSTE